MDGCLRRSPDFFSVFVDQHHEFLAGGQCSFCHTPVIPDRRVNDASLLGGRQAPQRGVQAVDPHRVLR